MGPVQQPLRVVDDIGDYDDAAPDEVEVNWPVWIAIAVLLVIPLLA